MSTELINRRFLEFVLYDWLGCEALFQRTRFAEHGRESVGALLDLGARLAGAEFLPHYKQADREEPRLTPDGVVVLPEVKRAVRAFGEAGLCAGPFDHALGGLQVPEVVHAALMAHVFAANIATAAYPMLTVANSRLLAAFGSPAQVEAFAKPQIAGAWLGTMCLSEPQAGSSLAEIATRARPDGADAFGARYRLVGNKMWISAGDHDISDNIVHLVLAKVPDPDGRLPPGTKGLSLFVVPKFLPAGPEGEGKGERERERERNDVVVAGLNHKMGYRGTANCLLNLGEGTRHRPGGAAGAVGYLVGQPGQGLALMFHMMNEARIAVGLGAAALAWRGYALSLAYARQRVQGRAPGDRSGTPQPISAHPDVKRMLLAQKSYAEGALALILYCARLVDDVGTAPSEAERREAESLLGLLTPVAKTWSSEWGLVANDLAIQVHGGYGYTRDFDVEQLYRDNRLNPIHEGTTGIQALDLVSRKVRRDAGASLALCGARIAATCTAAQARPDLDGFASALERRWAQVVAVAGQLSAALDAEAGWNATAFLSALGHVVVAWLSLDLATLAATTLQPGPFRDARLRVCRYMFEAELPKVDAWLALVASGTDVAAGVTDDLLDA